MSFPVPLSRFSKKLSGSPDEVYLGILKWEHRLEKHTIEEWYALIEKIKHPN